MSTKETIGLYLTNGRYDPYKSEKRKQILTIQRKNPKALPEDIHKGEFVRQRDMHLIDVIEDLYSNILHKLKLR